MGEQEGIETVPSVPIPLLVNGSPEREAEETCRGLGYKRGPSAVPLKVVMARYGDHCLACGSREKLVVDHVLSGFQGGTDTLDNLQPLCASCNFRKGLRTIDYRR